MNGDDFALVVLDGFKDLFDGVGGVGVIDDDFKILTSVDAVHATFDGIEGGNTLMNLLVGKAEFFADSESGKGIINIKLTGDLSGNFYITT